MWQGSRTPTGVRKLWERCCLGIGMTLIAAAVVVVVPQTDAVAAEPDIGPPPGACAPATPIPYPAIHAYCVRQNDHATISVTPTDVRDGTELTFTLNLITPECPSSIALRTYPCVSSIMWDWASNYAGPAYRLMVPDRTYFRAVTPTVNTYYQPFSYDHPSFSSCIGGNPFPSSAPTCVVQVRHVPGVGNLVPAWLVFMPAITVETGPTSHQTVYVETLARFHVDVEPPPPLAADFTVTPFGPAEFQFDPVVSGGVEPYRYLWDYDNGTAEEGVLGGVLYDEPGEYVVTLTVIDAAGAQVVSTKQVVVEPPNLLLGIEFVDQDDAHFNVGEGFTVRLSVHADGGVGDLADVRFDDQLAVVPSDALEFISGPLDLPVAAGIALANGEAKQYDYRVRVLHGGTFRLVAGATAEDAAGNPLPAASIEETGVVDSLSITVTFDTNPVQLQLALPSDKDGDGKIDGDLDGDGVPEEAVFSPATVTGTITVTNSSPDPITGITFQGTQSGLDLRSVVPAQALVPFPVVVTAGPGSIDRIDGGGHVDRTFTLEVSNGDSYEVRATLLGASGIANVAGFGSGQLDVLTDVKLRVDLKVSPLNGRPPRVEAGTVYAITGTVSNLSTTDTIDVGPIVARTAANARVLGVMQSAGSGPAPDICTCQIFSPTLTPKGSANDHADFTIWVATTKAAIASQTVARSWVRLFPLTASRQTDHGPEPLAENQTRVDLGNGRNVLQGLDGEPWLETIVENPLPTARVVDWGTFADYFLGSISENVVLGARDAGVSTLQLAGMLLSLAPSAIQAQFETMTGIAQARQLMALARYGLDTWNALPADEKGGFINQVVEDGKQQLVNAGQQTAQLQAAVEQEIQKFFTDLDDWFDKLDANLDSGDMVAVARILGEPARPLTQITVENIAQEAGFKYMCSLFKAGSKLAEPLRAVETADEAVEAARVENAVEAQASAGDPRAVEQVPEMRELPPNDRFSPSQAAKGYGVDGVSDHNLREVTKRVPLMVAIRRRAAETLEWLQSKIGATLKPEGLYQKNVSELDALLGYRAGSPGYGAGDIGSLVLAEPIPVEELERRIAGAGLNDAEADAVRARWKDRYEEWYGKLDANGQVVPRASGHASLMDEVRTIANRPIKDASGNVVGFEGEFMVPKDGTINWGPNFDLAGKQNSMTMRRIQLRQVANPPDAGLFANGRQYYEVWLEDKDGVLKRVVGDIDVMGVWSVSGNVLPKSIAQQTAELLTQLTGLEHGWSWTYIERNKELQRVLWNVDPAKRGEGMLLYVNGEARQVWLRQVTSAEIPVQFVDIEGAPILYDELKTNVPLGEIKGIDVKQLPMPQGYVAPSDSLRFANNIDRGPGVPPAAQLVTSTAPDAAALRLGAGNELEQWNPNTGWRPSALDNEVAAGKRTTLFVLPQTGVSQPTPAGATEVAVFDQAGFLVGQTVVIDPGGAHQEEAVVIGFGSLVLDHPLRFAHDPGEMITVKSLPATLPKTGAKHTPQTGATAGALLAAGLTLLGLSRRRQSAGVA